MRYQPLSEARVGPIWRRPEAFLVLTAIAMPLSFSVWSALLNNF
ncbi:MAG: MFS transporter, partial [Pseudomonadota bacterium]